jgi:uncharacterized membrane protein
VVSLPTLFHKFRWLTAPLVCILLGFLLLFLPGISMESAPPVIQFFGRLHPVLLHFPIVLVILLTILELLGALRLISAGRGVTAVLLMATAVSTAVSVLAGFFLFSSGEYEGALIERHMWAGVLTGFLVMLTMAGYFLYMRYPVMRAAYLVLLIVTTAFVGYASHLGGSITHGQQYLTEHLQLMMLADEHGDIRTRDEMLLFEDIILPVMEAKCISCHNEQRAKGGLKLTSYEHLLRTGDSGKPCVTPGDSAESELLNRIVLPTGHSDRMPPEGKSALSNDELSLFRYWIRSGAAENVLVENIAPDSIRPILNRMLPELDKYRRRNLLNALSRAELDSELRELGNEIDVTIVPDSTADEDFYAMAMRFPPAPFSNEQFKSLQPYVEVFSKLSLVGSGIDDDGLYHIAKMKNVRYLYLQKTGLDGTGLIYLRRMPNLEVLNLSFTGVNDEAVIDLLGVPQLKRVYLYRTKTTPAVLEALRKNKPGLELVVEEGPYF